MDVKKAFLWSKLIFYSIFTCWRAHGKRPGNAFLHYHSIAQKLQITLVKYPNSCHLFSRSNFVATD